MTAAVVRHETTPDGCRWCGLPQYDHAQRWKPPVGWHTWAAPTNAQRLARMKARRNTTTTTPEEGTP